MNYRWVKAVLCIMTFSLLSACSVYEIPEVHFSFATTAEGKYTENIREVPVGKRFYTAVDVRIATNKKKPRNYEVKVVVPFTKDIEIQNMGGGIVTNSNEWDPSRQVSILNFTVQGYREAHGETIQFYGTPNSEGKADIKVFIYNNEKDGKHKLIKTAHRTIFFEYNVGA